MPDPLYAVIGHARAFDGAMPYAGPVAPTKEQAIDAFVAFAIANEEAPEEMQRIGRELRDNPLETRVLAYDGDEVLICQELKHA